MIARLGLQVVDVMKTNLTHLGTMSSEH